MQSDEYIVSEEVEAEIKQFLSNQKVTNDAKKTLDIKDMILKSFNMGFFSSLKSKKAVTGMGDIEKTQEITSYMPVKFKDSDSGQLVTDRVMESILACTTDYVLNIGYEDIVRKSVSDAIMFAYSIGITAGFDIARDKNLSVMFQENLDRFIRKGVVGEKK